MADIDQLATPPQEMQQGKFNNSYYEYRSPLGGWEPEQHAKILGQQALATSDAVRGGEIADPTFQANNHAIRKPGYGESFVYNTQLPENEETQFRQWVSQNKIPFDPEAHVSDYDMRGYWRALQAGDPVATQSINQSDQQPHFPDYWKTPYHKTFSSESRWANPETAPRWNESGQLMSRDGRIVFDERAEAAKNANSQNRDEWKTFSEEMPKIHREELPMIGRDYLAPLPSPASHLSSGSTKQAAPSAIDRLFQILKGQ